MQEERQGWKKTVAGPGDESEVKLAFRENPTLGKEALVVGRSQGTPVDYG